MGEAKLSPGVDHVRGFAGIRQAGREDHSVRFRTEHPEIAQCGSTHSRLEEIKSLIPLWLTLKSYGRVTCNPTTEILSER